MIEGTPATMREGDRRWSTSIRLRRSSFYRLPSTGGARRSGFGDLPSAGFLRRSFDRLRMRRLRRASNGEASARLRRASRRRCEGERGGNGEYLGVGGGDAVAARSPLGYGLHLSALVCLYSLRSC